MLKKRFICIGLAMFLLVGCKTNNDEDINKSNTIAQYIGDCSFYNNGTAYKIGNKSSFTNIFLDFDSMETTVLCQKPNCDHKSSDCFSKLIGYFYKPIFYNDYIYYFQSNGGAVRNTSDGSEFYIDSKLYRTKIDSFEKEVFCEFDDAVPRETGNYVLRNSELYFIADDRGAEKDDYGTYNWGNTGGNFFLCSIDLETGKYANHGQVYEEDKKFDNSKNSRSENIYGIYNDKMYISHAYVKDPNVEFTSDDRWSYVNFEYDLKLGTLSKSDLPASPYMNEDCYIYYDNSQNKVKAVYQGKDYEFNLCFNNMEFRDSHCSELNGKIFFPTIGKWYELSDMSEHSMNQYSGYEAISYYNDCYIFVNGKKSAKLTEDKLLALDKE